jgi:hypothetical protein
MILQLYILKLTIPQSISKICPETELALSEVKKVAMFATSSGLRNFLRG